MRTTAFAIRVPREGPTVRSDVCRVQATACVSGGARPSRRGCLWREGSEGKWLKTHRGYVTCPSKSANSPVQGVNIRASDSIGGGASRSPRKRRSLRAPGLRDEGPSRVERSRTCSRRTGVRARAARQVEGGDTQCEEDDAVVVLEPSTTRGGDPWKAPQPVRRSSFATASFERRTNREPPGRRTP